jgi:UDP-galactopyranose mutase
MTYDILCFSHLRWGGVFQRPQHLLSRLARTHRVFLIEEPEYEDTATPYFEPIPSGTDNVFVFRPRMRASSPFYVDGQINVISALTQELLERARIRRYVAWLYTPMALPVVVASCTPVARVFDCMDELSAFRFAPPELRARDRATMQWADIVFTGGRSLYEARRRQHPNLYCFPSSVDAAHFAAARAETTREAAAQCALPRPRLGYFGVIDERVDYDILAALAQSHREWQIVMVGPFAKVDPAEVPRFPNLHYLGQQAYADLPGFLKGWDVALIPFAQSDATRYLSPTKVLEYMAADLPIVATPLPDLLPYRAAVLFADSPATFVAACEHALSASVPQRSAWAAEMRATVAATSWEATVRAMEGLIDRVVITGPVRQEEISLTVS